MLLKGESVHPFSCFEAQFFYFRFISGAFFFSLLRIIQSTTIWNWSDFIWSNNSLIKCWKVVISASTAFFWSKTWSHRVNKVCWIISKTIECSNLAILCWLFMSVPCKDPSWQTNEISVLYFTSVALFLFCSIRTCIFSPYRISYVALLFQRVLFFFLLSNVFTEVYCAKFQKPQHCRFFSQ